MNKEYYRKLFPLLTDYELIQNSENNKYNCVSHTLNIKDKWIWPYLEDEIYIRKYNSYWTVKNEISKSHSMNFMSIMDLRNWIY